MFNSILRKAVYKLLGAALITGFMASGLQADMTGPEIIDKYIETQYVESELAFISMTTYIPGPNSVTKKHRFLALTKKFPDGNHGYMIRMVRPKEVQGVTLLSVEEGEGDVAQYYYLPDVGRVTRISGDSRSNTFLSSDFTFEDLLREMPQDFKYERQADTFVHGAECYAVRAEPSAKNSKSNYSHRILYIDKNDFNLQQIDFYAKKNKLTKTMEAFEYNSPAIKGESVRPRYAVMNNVESKSVTIFHVVESRLGLKLDDELFTPDKIQNWAPDEVSELIFDLGFTVTDEPGS